MTNWKAVEALTTEAELTEARTIGLKRTPIALKRTFNQKWPNGAITKYWRVIGPAGHPNINSDLSLEGLREWGIV